MKRFKETHLITGMLVLLTSSLCWAQDIDLERIVVTPSRIEESYGDISRKVDIITSEDIESSNAKDIAEVLTEITSVNISNYGGLGALKNIRMRGSTAAQVLVLVDGRPVNNPRDGEANLSDIPLDNIARIEVMHGPGSSLYGSSAMGGVVNIITKGPPREGQKVEAYSSFGTARTYVERMLYGAKLSKFGYLISGEYQSSEGFRDNSEFTAKDSNLKLEYELNSENNISLNSGFYKSRLGTPGSTSYVDTDDKQNTLKRFFDFNWGFRPDERTGLSLKAYQNYDRLEFVENSASYTKDIHATTARGLDLQLDKQFADNYRLVCGFNYVKNLNDSTSSAKHKYYVRAGYLENRLDLFDRKLNLNLNARIDDYSNFGTELNPGLSFLYNLNNGIKLRGLISRSFRAPTFNDLYWPRTDYPWGGGESGNADLNPEKGLTEEIGVETKINKYFTTELTYFHSKYKQLIQWSADESGFWRPDNVSSAVIDGIEFKNKISITENLNLNLDYSFLIARNDETHKYLVYQPKNKVDYSLQYKGLNGFTCGLKGQFTDKRFYDAANTVKVEKFFVFGLNASKKFKNGLTYFVNIDNLLNRKYQVIQDYPMPGFSITNGMKLEF